MTPPDPAAASPGTGRRPRRFARTRIPIRFKVLCVLVVLASICSVVMSRTLIAYFNEDKATYIQDLNADIASNTAASLGLLLRFYAERLQRVSESFNLSDNPAQALSEVFDRSDDLVYLAVYDESGENLLSLCREGMLEDAGVAFEPYRTERSRLDTSLGYLKAHGSLARNSSSSPRLLSFALTLPFPARAYGRTFALRADFLSRHVLGAIERTPGFTTYVVDKTGEVFAHPDPVVLAERRSFAGRRVVQALLANLSVAAAGTGEFADPGAEPVLASYAAVREAGLGVLVERPRADAYLAASRVTERSMKAAAIVMIIATLFSVLLSRALTAPLLALSRAAGRLERGDFAARVEPGSNDELGDLARSFNLAAEGLKERDLKLKEAYEQLLQSEKLAGFGKFSAGIAHEIKNPLTGIIGFAQLLVRKLAADDPRRPPLTMIEKEAKRCKTILDNLLKFTRKEGFQFEPVRLHAHIRETLELLAPQLSMSQVEVRTALEAPDDLIRGDSNQLRQVFMNLTLNAIDAVEKSARKVVTITTCSGEPGHLEVTVGDTGSGIPADKLRKVFDPFFTTKEPGKGTGLGLSVSYGIITNHGGRIGVNSEPDRGAEFRIVLPCAPNDVRAVERQRRTRRAAGESTPSAGYPAPAAPTVEPVAPVAGS